MRAGRCPGKPGKIRRLATLILPENLNSLQGPFWPAAKLCRKSCAPLRRDLIPKEKPCLPIKPTTLKAIWRDHGAGRLSDADAQAAAEAVHARRARREGDDTARAGKAACGLPRPAARRAKIFGPGRGRPIDRNARARLMHQALAKRRRRIITRADLDVLRALLFDFLNRADGRCFPSLQTIAKAVGCAVSTVAEAIKRLEASAPSDVGQPNRQDPRA